MIMRHGTEQNKHEFLPGIARGEIVFALGYSEPNAGTDLASLRTRAVRDGDEWVINGSKIWNSGAQRSTHEWLCVRTDPDAPRHRGISVIAVPVDSPGIEIRPLYAWSGYRTNETFFNDVRVPVTNLIGEVNAGWTYITGALDLERGALTNAGDLRRALDDLDRDGGRPGSRVPPPPRAGRGRRRSRQADGLEAASMLDSGRIPTVEVSVEKIFTSELRQRIADLAIDLLGPDGLRVGELLRAALPGVAAHALRRRHQRGAPRRHRPARPRACRRTGGDGMRVIPDQDERDLAAMCRSVLAAELEPDSAVEGAGRSGRARAGRSTAASDDLGRLLHRSRTSIVSQSRSEHGVCGTGHRLARCGVGLAAPADVRRETARRRRLVSPRDAAT